MKRLFPFGLRTGRRSKKDDEPQQQQQQQHAAKKRPSSSSPRSLSILRSSSNKKNRRSKWRRSSSVNFSLDKNTYHRGRLIDSQQELRDLWWCPVVMPQQQQQETTKPPEQSLYTWLPNYVLGRLYILLCGELLFMYYHRKFLEFTSLMFLCEQCWVQL